MMGNKSKKEEEYVLTPAPGISAADEIYVYVKNDVPKLYFYYEIIEADLNLVG